MDQPPIGQEPQNNVVRDASTFIWMVLEVAGSPLLRDAARALYPGERAVATLEDALRHMLFVAVAILCESASGRVSGEAATGPAAEGSGAAQVVQSARGLIAAVQQASGQELAEAHAYFLAPPRNCELVKQQPALADLSFGVVRFMIECAAECLV